VHPSNGMYRETVSMDPEGLHVSAWGVCQPPKAGEALAEIDLIGSPHQMCGYWWEPPQVFGAIIPGKWWFITPTKSHSVLLTQETFRISALRKRNECGGSERLSQPFDSGIAADSE